MVANAAQQTSKRRLEPEEEKDSAQHRAFKRPKTEIQHRYSVRFWDSLSHVRLTRRALKELDRRSAERAVAEKAITEKAGATLPYSKLRILRSDYRRLIALARCGGPNLNSIRGYSSEVNKAGRGVEMSQSSSRSLKRSLGSGTPRRSATSSRTTTPYSGEFEQKLIDRGIYPEGHRVDTERTPRPANIVELRNKLAESRSSLSPSAFSEGAFDDFQDTNRRAKSESKAINKVVPIITGAKDKEHECMGDVLFTRLAKFDEDLSTPKPDTYYGARPTQIDTRVRRELDQYIIPSNRTNLPVAPNFFFEGKSAAGRPDVAQRQAMYDGAVGARGMLRLQNYGSHALTYDENAYTITSTYHPGTGTLQMYATHPRLSGDGRRTEYYMTQLNTYGMTGNINSFRQGAAAYRNARDWMRQERDRLIANANIVAQRQSAETTSRSRSRSLQASGNNNEVSPDSDTSIDELLNCDATKRQRTRQTPR